MKRLLAVPLLALALAGCSTQSDLTATWSKHLTQQDTKCLHWYVAAGQADDENAASYYCDMAIFTPGSVHKRPLDEQYGACVTAFKEADILVDPFMDCSLAFYGDTTH